MLDVLMDGLSTTIIGLLVVFFGLIILIGAISLMRVFSVKEKKTPASPVKSPAPVVAQADDGAVIAAITAAMQLEQESVVAAITAAISMMLQQEGKTNHFIVRRIRRVGTHR